MKTFLKRTPPFRWLYCWIRCQQMEREFRRHREQYAAAPVAATQLISPSQTKEIGDIHTFAIIPLVSWHESLLPDLRLLGPVTHFNYHCRMENDREFLSWRSRMNAELLACFEQAHRKSPVDWVFAYVQGRHILKETVRTIRKLFGVRTVNLCLDDKQSWDKGSVGGQSLGSRDIAAAFNLWWTSATVTVRWINAEGGNAIYLPEGCNANSFPCEELPLSIPVSFVGAAYGRRLDMVAFLRRHGVEVQTYGRGWCRGSEVSAARMIEVFRTSLVNLGHGGAGYSEIVLNVKGRDFEIPCAGGGAYLTTFNHDLTQHFHIGHEILCWHSYDDLLEQVRHLLEHPDVSRELARRARRRCLAEHRWIHRYMKVLETLGILPYGQGARYSMVDEAGHKTPARPT